MYVKLDTALSAAVLQSARSRQPMYVIERAGVFDPYDVEREGTVDPATGDKVRYVISALELDK